MNKLPKISIIIPLYNKEDYICNTVNSVINQTYKDFEIIIINDGSTDSSLERLKTLHDERIKIISQENSGVSAARNRGVKESASNYIAFLDGDDWWEKTYLFEINLLINTYPDAGLYGTNYKEVKKGVETIKISSTDGYINLFNLFLKYKESPINSSCAVVKKNVFTKVGGFNPKLKIGEDFHLWFSIASEYKVAYCNKPLSNYNQNIPEINRASFKINNFEKNAIEEENIIFNWGDLETKALNNNEIKKVIDVITLDNLRPFFFAGKKRSVKERLRYIDNTNITLKFRIYYAIPHKIAFFLFKVYKKACNLK